MQETKDANLLKSFCESFCQVVEKYCKYIVVSGYLAIATGRSRGTQDIDMILEQIPKEKFISLHNELGQHGFHCIQDDNPEELYQYYLDEKASIRYIFEDQPLPEMEIKFAKDALDRIQIESRTKIPLTNVDVWFGSIEMNIAFKEEYLKSEKDLEDAHHLRIVFKEQIEEKRINSLKKLIREIRLK